MWLVRVESEATDMFRLWPPIGLKLLGTKRVKLTELPRLSLHKGLVVTSKSVVR